MTDPHETAGSGNDPPSERAAAPRKRVVSPEIERAIERGSAKFADELRRVSEELGQLHASNAAARGSRSAEPGPEPPSTDDVNHDNTAHALVNRTAAPPDRAIAEQAASAPPAAPPAIEERIWRAEATDQIEIPAAVAPPAPRHPSAVDEPAAPARTELTWAFSFRGRLIAVLVLGIICVSVVIVLLRAPRASGDLAGASAAATPPAQRALGNPGQPGARSAPTSPPAVLADRATHAAPSTQAPQAATVAAAPQSTAPADRATATTEPRPTATSRPLAAGDLLRQVATAEGQLRTGEFEATIDYGNGTLATAQLRFDLGADGKVPSIHIISTYSGPAGSQKAERVTIGDRSWERQSDGSWSAREAHEAVADQVRVFLPHADTITTTAQLSSGDPTTLSWHDSSRNSDVTMIVDPTTGVPRELREVRRTTGAVLAVTYRSWNTAVDITAPKGP